MLSLQKATQNDSAIIETIFEKSRDYFRNTEGIIAPPTAGEETLSVLPPNTRPDQKHVFLIKKVNTPVAVADLIDGYPNADTAFLGLLLVSQDVQGKRIGTNSYLLLENFILENTKCTRIRLSVVESNPVIPFWEKMGFKLTGESKPHEGEKLKSRKLLMEKKFD